MELNTDPYEAGDVCIVSIFGDFGGFGAKNIIGNSFGGFVIIYLSPMQIGKIWRNAFQEKSV